MKKISNIENEQLDYEVSMDILLEEQVREYFNRAINYSYENKPLSAEKNISKGYEILLQEKNNIYPTTYKLLYKCYQSTSEFLDNTYINKHGGQA